MCLLLSFLPKKKEGEEEEKEEEEANMNELRSLSELALSQREERKEELLLEPSFFSSTFLPPVPRRKIERRDGIGQRNKMEMRASSHKQTQFKSCRY